MHAENRAAAVWRPSYFGFEPSTKSLKDLGEREYFDKLDRSTRF
jgi:hypothetical protein